MRVPAKTGTAAGSRLARTRAPERSRRAEVEQLLTDKRIGPLEGFRSKAGWPFTASIILKFNEDEKNWKLEFDFGNDDKDTGELVDFSADEPLGTCPKDGGRVFETPSSYVCENAVRTEAKPEPTCDFKSRKVILQQPIEPAQMMKLLATGKTDQLEKFISNRTRRPFKAFLVWDKEAGKVNFEFAPSKYPSRRPRAAARPAREAAAAGPAPAKKVSARGKASKAAKERRAQGGPEVDRQAADAERRARGRRRQRAVGSHRSDQEAVGLHQGEWPAGRHQQARDQRRRAAAAHLRQAAGDDVRARQGRRPAPLLSTRNPEGARGADTTRMADRWSIRRQQKSAF